MSGQTVEIDWQHVLEIAGPYPREAFDFVQEGLGYTVRQVHGDPSKKAPGQRHVSGQQLCLGLRDYAIRKYGLLARSVFEHWNIHRTDDFGRIIFAMIEAGLMSQSDEDQLEDFVGVYQFNDAFDRTRILEMLMNN